MACHLSLECAERRLDVNLDGYRNSRRSRWFCCKRKRGNNGFIQRLKQPRNKDVRSDIKQALSSESELLNAIFSKIRQNL